MAKNAVLLRAAEPHMVAARTENLLREKTAHFYLDTRYRAGTWSRERRVVIKAEVVQLSGRPPRDNPRFVVTNLRQTPRFIYEKVYCGRGDIENRIKELHDGLQLDRTSCHSFWANQLRVLLTAAAYQPVVKPRVAPRAARRPAGKARRGSILAIFERGATPPAGMHGRSNAAGPFATGCYVLMQEMRLRAARTACARTQVTWLRDRLLKLGAHVVRSVRRLVVHLPRATPDLHAWRQIALALGARAG